MAKRIVLWSLAARADLRAIDRNSASDILHAVDRYLETGSGDVVNLQPPRNELRLRCGDYRVIFLRSDLHTIEILRVRHRRDAYR